MIDLIDPGEFQPCGWEGRQDPRGGDLQRSLHPPEIYLARRARTAFNYGGLKAKLPHYPGGNMRRREFISLLAGAAAWPSVGRAQQALPVIGYLSSGSRTSHPTEAFHKGLQEAGYVEGQNILVEYRFAEGQYDKLPTLAADLVARRVAVIAAVAGTASALAAKAATTSIPIVFEAGGDPVKAGLVRSINRPGGNVTGVNLFASALGEKRLELLTEMVPAASELAMLINSANPNAVTDTDDAQAAARSLHRQLQVVDASDDSELNAAFTRLVQLRVSALMVMVDPFFLSRRTQIASLALRNQILVCYGLREFVAAGGLISYGTSIADVFRQAGVYVGKVIKGENPADLPILQPTKFELVINLKTAKSLGITIPLSLLSRADEVIE